MATGKDRITDRIPYIVCGADDERKDTTLVWTVHRYRIAWFHGVWQNLLQWGMSYGHLDAGSELDL
jgi:hypothetical protein